MNCVACGAIVHWETDRCPRCGLDVGPPNLRLISTREERAALTARADVLLNEARSRGAESAVKQFEAVVAVESHAVLNVSADFVWRFISDKRSLYVGYEILVNAGMRKAAAFDDDRRRRSVDALVHGALAEKITCAALSLDGNGLVSYGVAALTLSDRTAAANATLLEENSYQFVTKHELLPEDPLPTGCRSTWSDRGVLAVAKLGSRILLTTGQDEFPRLLLNSTTSRLDDEFIEVHVWGRFDWQAIEHIVIDTRVALTEEERQLLNNTKDLATAAGISWQEV